MKVLKFGGTSVSSSDSIEKVISILQAKSENDAIVVVVSALGEVTDLLVRVGELANNKNDNYLEIYNEIREKHLSIALELYLSESSINRLNSYLEELRSILQGIYLINEFSNKTKDRILSFGELLSSFIISESLKNETSNSQLKDSRELILTDSNFTKAELLFEKTEKNIQDYFGLNSKQITVMPGFISRNKKGDTTTLGRDGSDYSAAIIAGALNASILEIWTDVNGMYTANPKIVKQAFPIAEISYEEAMELSHFGSKVLYPPAIKPVLDKNIPINIKNTFNAEALGTVVNKKVNSKHGPVKGISHLSDISLLTIEGAGISKISGISSRLFSALADKNINIILITQASSEYSICIAVVTKDAHMAKKVINSIFAYEISLNKINLVIVENDLAIIAIVGEKMKSHQGISGKMFSSLGENNINIRAIAQGASERNISAVIAAKNVKKALNILHHKFFEKQVQTLNLFIVGVGNVGKRLINQIQNQYQYLLDSLLIDLRVVGMSNSQKMIFNEEGVCLLNWEEQLKNGQSKNDDEWLSTVAKMNLRNSIFVDITANKDVAYSYGNYLSNSISVVACNKIACSSEFSRYQRYKELSRKYNASFLFETNVGAALPVIGTLNNLVNSGDKITSIKAVLSGSLNFIFNNFNSETSFYDVVKRAAKEGYTEPDPRIDLSGIDVARKILILARESDHQLNLEDIENETFLPKSCIEANTVDDFYQALKGETQYFKSLYEKNTQNNMQLKYVAEFNNGKAKVSLQQVNKNHPFYNLDGKDNIVLFCTARYVDQPLIIKGAGAGAEVTASGLFGDIISLAKK
ncbi:bifunctional aspartate kinase/homoserine dehydrogenase I [Flavobacteriaceae bacterium AU392]|nr:bifunctional aspartate kinase/homoserine dehydrogenase I [Flavobacteriaceae bacterium]RKM84214.1 bifunctional aspartate kinase/homoserine dehydrogenase I [Flavobacteriaceae bacterium AU392]